MYKKDLKRGFHLDSGTFEYQPRQIKKEFNRQDALQEKQIQKWEDSLQERAFDKSTPSKQSQESSSAKQEIKCLEQDSQDEKEEEEEESSSEDEAQDAKINSLRMIIIGEYKTPLPYLRRVPFLYKTKMRLYRVFGSYYKTLQAINRCLNFPPPRPAPAAPQDNQDEQEANSGFQDFYQPPPMVEDYDGDEHEEVKRDYFKVPLSKQNKALIINDRRLIDCEGWNIRNQEEIRIQKLDMYSTVYESDEIENAGITKEQSETLMKGRIPASFNPNHSICSKLLDEIDSNLSRSSNLVDFMLAFQKFNYVTHHDPRSAPRIKDILLRVVKLIKTHPNKQVSNFFSKFGVFVFLDTFAVAAAKAKKKTHFISNGAMKFEINLKQPPVRERLNSEDRDSSFNLSELNDDQGLPQPENKKESSSSSSDEESSSDTSLKAELDALYSRYQQQISVDRLLSQIPPQLLGLNLSDEEWPDDYSIIL